MRQIVFRYQARRELDEAGDWYEQERIGLRLEFFVGTLYITALQNHYQGIPFSQKEGA